MALLPESRLMAKRDAAAMRVALTREQIFVWTRIEPHATVSDICAISGLSEFNTLEILRFLIAKGLVIVEDEPAPQSTNLWAYTSMSSPAASIVPPSSPRSSLGNSIVPPSSPRSSLGNSIVPPAFPNARTSMGHSAAQNNLTQNDTPGNWRTKNVLSSKTPMPSGPAFASTGSGFGASGPVFGSAIPKQGSQIAGSQPLGGATGFQARSAQPATNPNLLASGLQGSAFSTPGSSSPITGAHTPVPAAVTANGLPLEVKCPPFFGVEDRDARALKALGKDWYVAGEPVSFADGRYYGISFDKYILLERCDLSIEQRRKLLATDARFDDMDLFALLETEPTDDPKELKKAYFQFSRQMHPDAYFGKNLGRYKELIIKIFKSVTARYEHLLQDESLRKTYARAIKARNEAYRQRLEGERLAQQQQAYEAKRLQAEARKLELQEKLNAQLERKRQQAMSPILERNEKAKAAYEEGQKLEQAGSVAQAVSSYQRAMLYDGSTPAYKEAYDRCLKQTQAAKAEALWKEGKVQESVGSLRDAVQYYQQAVKLDPKAEYLTHLVEILLPRTTDLHYLADLAQKVTEQKPDVAYHWQLLGQVYEQARLLKKAQSAYERALKLDPKNDGVKKALKALNRPT